MLWLLPGLPALAGTLLACAGRRADRVAAGVTLAVLLLTAGLAGWAAATRPAVDAAWLGPLRAALAVDGLSAVMVLTVVAIALAVVVFATAELGAEQARARFFGLLQLFVGAMLATVTATTLGTLLVAWEIMGATSWALIGFWWSDPARAAAANSAFLVTRAGDLGLYLAAAAAFAGAGTLRIASLTGLEGGWLHLTAAGLLLAAAGKSAQLPFSPWLSAAMQGPTPVSALLHSATMVAAGAYLLLRAEPLLTTAGWAGDVAAWLGALTALLLGLVAVAQRDLKQLLAASTCSQMGFVFLAAGVASVNGGTAHLVGHAAFKALLFLGAGVYLHALGTKELAELRGAGRGALAAVTLILAVGALALAGLPPLSGWVTKDQILAAALHGSPALYAVGLAAALLSAAYAGKVLAILYAPGPTERQRPDHAMSARLVAPLLVLAIATVSWSLVGLPAVRRWLAGVLATPPGPAPTPPELLLSGVVAAGGLALAWRWRRSGRLLPWKPAALPAGMAAWAARWLDLPRAAHALVVGPVLSAAAGLARVDDRVVDAGVRGAAGVGARLSVLSRLADRHVLDRAVSALTAGAVRGGDASRAADERLVDRAVERLAAALGRAGAAARRPQSGMISSYYSGALAVLAGLAALAWLVKAIG